MPKLESALIIFALVAAGHAFTDADDVNRLSLVMRPEDVLRVDMRKLMSFRGTSINFFSNNPDVRLPGVTSDPPAVFEKDTSFHPIIVKNKKGRVFMVQSDRRRLQMYDLIERDTLNPVDHKLKFLSLPGIDAGIADLHLEEDSLTVLFYDWKDQANPGKAATSRYFLMNVMLDSMSTEKVVSFTAPWCQNPTLKMFSAHPAENLRDFVFLVFDKDSDAEGVLGPAKGFTLVKVDFATSPDAIPAPNIVTRKLNDLLFRRELVAVRLKNVLMATQHRHSIYFVVQDADKVASRRHMVYSCEVNLRPDSLDALTFTNCGLFKKQPVKQFFLKGAHYIAIADSSKMEFCSVVTGSCREGVIQDTWDLRSVLMEGDLAVLIMSIQKTKFIFINNFRDNTLTWFYDERTPIRPAYLFYGVVNGLTHSFLVEVPEQGLSFRDIALNPFFEVRGSQLKHDQLTNVYLEDKLVLSYDLKPLGEKKVNNLQEDRLVEVLIEPGSKEFRTKLDIVGSDLRFSENGLRRIKYFNPMAFQIRWEPGQLKGTPHHFYREWMIFRNVIVKLACVAQKETYGYHCEEVGKIDSPRPVEVAAITTVEEMGSFVVVLSEVSDNIVIFDREHNTVLGFEYPPRFLNGHTCMRYLAFIACAYPVPHADVPATTVRLFSVRRDGLEEVPGFEEAFLASIDRIVRESPWEAKKLTSVSISAFDFDDVQIEKLFVLFIFGFDDNSARSVYGEYRFESDPNTGARPRLQWVGRNTHFENDAELVKSSRMYVLDAQTVFYSFNSKFVLMCYEGDSKYFFDHLEVVRLHSVRLVSTHSLVVVVFQGHQERHFFAIFQITQNAAKQLLRLEEIPDFDEHYRLSAIVIDDWTLGFYQYNPVTGKELPSYMYFRNGPILVSSSFDQELVVNRVALSLRFAQDKLFDVARNRMVKSTHFAVTPDSRRLSLKLKDYFSFDGNMYDIELDKASQDAGAVLKKPLEIAAQAPLLTVEATTKPEDMSIAYSSAFLVIQENRKAPLYRVFSREDPSVKLTADFRTALAPGATCEQVVLSEAHLLCLWTKDALPMLSGFRFRTAELLRTSFILPEAMSQVKVLNDNASKLTLLYRDVGRKYVCWFELDFGSLASTRRIIGKREMSVDDLNVLDYFFQLNENRNRLTIVMLDGHSNQLLIFHASTSDYQQEPVLKRAVPLSHLDNEISSLHCLESSPTELRFYCMLLSPTRLHYLTIANVAKSKVSLFTWEVTTTRKFYNVLFATTLDENLNIRSLADFENFFIHQADLATCKDPLLVRYSLLDPNYHHSSFALPLEPFKGIVAVVPGAPRHSADAQKIDTVELFHLVDGTLHRVTLATGDYLLEHPTPFALEGKRLVLRSRFFNNQNPSDLFFSFAERRTGKDEAKKQRNLRLVLLVVGIILASVFILVALFALLVLLRDRKKILLGANQPADETEVDISYM